MKRVLFSSASKRPLLRCVILVRMQSGGQIMEILHGIRL